VSWSVCRPERHSCWFNLSRAKDKGVFDYIEAEIGRIGECGPNGCACDGGRTIDVVYDTALGYPKRIDIGSYKDWSTVGWCWGHSLAAPLGGPVTVSVTPIE
jgi:hypothetical protein